ncbi:MAG TPA: tripartite tricarboxylate transporter substrate binding protein [Vineibacter sp.]|nr:tripartite tricarboxylate transporter substrate binding protein [Vineibacter sp.]
MHRRSFVASVALAGVVPAAVRAQALASKQIRILVGFAPGGGGDTVARILGQELTRDDGLSILVDNKPGAGGNVATRELVRATADGTTVMLANVGVLAVNPYAMKNAGYDPQTDLVPVSMAVEFANVLVVHPSVPARTLAEYLALAKRPEGMTYGTSGIGSAGHLGGELLRSMSGARLTHAPYRGGGPAMNDLIAGHVPSLIASAPTATGFMREGRIRALAVTSARRSPFDPEVPTIAELGFAGYDATNWYALVAPAKTPPDIVAALNALFVKALKAPDVREALAKQGIESTPSTPQVLAERITSEGATWKKIIAAAGIRIE